MKPAAKRPSIAQLVRDRKAHDATLDQCKSAGEVFAWLMRDHFMRMEIKRRREAGRRRR